MQMLDVAISLALVYLMMAGIVSGLQEVMATAFQWRGEYLKRGIDSLLQSVSAKPGEPLVERLYAHPSFQALRDGQRLPSYVSAATFATTLADELVRGAQVALPLFKGLPEAVRQMPESPLKQQLQLLVDRTEGHPEALQKALEVHFDEVMARVSGWYKRRAQWVGFFLALGCAVLINVDSIAIVGHLKRNPGEAQRLADQAALMVAQKPADAASAAAAEDPAQRLVQQVKAVLATKDQLLSLQLPIGWAWCEVPQGSAKTCADVAREQAAEAARTVSASAPAAAPAGSAVSAASAAVLAVPSVAPSAASAPETQLRLATPLGWTSVVGWLITAMAALMGAPFWFDLISRVIPLRGNGKPAAGSAPAVAPPPLPPPAPPPVNVTVQLPGAPAPAGEAPPAPAPDAAGDLAPDDFERTRLNDTDITTLQRALGLGDGALSGALSGVIDAPTREALRRWQLAQGQAVSGRFDEPTVLALLHGGPADAGTGA